MDALYDAAAAGDLASVQHYMACPDVLASIVAWDAEHRARRLWNQFAAIDQPSWFYSWDRDHDLLRSCIIQNGHVELLQWFFEPVRVATMENTLLALLPGVTQAIVKCRDRAAGLAMFEVVAESTLFNQTLDESERSKVMVEMMSVAASKDHNQWLQLLLSYGADPHVDVGGVSATDRRH